MIRRGIFYLCFCLVFILPCFAEVVKVAENTQERTLTIEGRELVQTTRYFTLDTGRNVYTISYTYRVDPETGEYSAGNPGVCGIGIIGPSDRSGWGRDFINVASNREDLRNCKPEITTKSGMDKACVNFCWTWKSGKIVNIRFMGKSGDPFLYTRVKTESPVGVFPQHCVITLLTSPAPRGHAPEPYLKTAARKAVPKQEVLLNPEETCIAYLDDYWDFSQEGRPSNTAGLILDPTRFKEVKILVHSLITTFFTNLKDEAQFALLEIKEMGNDSFLDSLKQNTAMVLANLATPDFFEVEEKIKIQPPTD